MYADEHTNTLTHTCAVRTYTRIHTRAATPNLIVHGIIQSMMQTSELFRSRAIRLSALSVIDCSQQGHVTRERPFLKVIQDALVDHSGQLY